MEESLDFKQIPTVFAPTISASQELIKPSLRQDFLKNN
jgi:hypothetical protein